MPDLADDILDAGLEPERWNSVLASVSEALRGASVVLCHDAVDTLGQGAFWSHNCDPSAFHDFPRETWHPSSNAFIAFMLNAPEGRVYDRRQFLDDAFASEHPFGLEFRDKCGMHHMLACAAQRDRDTISVVQIGRDASQPLETEELRMAERLVRYMRHSLRVLRATRRLEAGNLALAAVLDRLDQGVLLCDGHLRVRHANSSAASMLEQGAVLREYNGRLRVNGAAAQRELEDVVRRMAAPTPCEERAIVTHDAIDQRRWTVAAVPVLGDATSEIAHRAQVMLIISSDAVPRPVDSACLAERHGLTRAEARVAYLAGEALSYAEIAERSGSSVNTVKTHLRAVYDKVGVRSQAELVRLVLKKAP